MFLAVVTRREAVAPNGSNLVVVFTGALAVVDHIVEAGYEDFLSWPVQFGCHGTVSCLELKRSAYQRSLKWSSLERRGHRRMGLTGGPVPTETQSPIV